MTFRLPRVTEDTGPPDDPVPWSDLAVGPASLRARDDNAHAIIRGENGRRHEGPGGKLYKRFGPASDWLPAASCCDKEMAPQLNRCNARFCGYGPIRQYVGH
jgi:hypothetical protein